MRKNDYVLIDETKQYVSLILSDAIEKSKSIFQMVVLLETDLIMLLLIVQEEL